MRLLVAYIAGGLTLLVAELIAVASRRRGDTITEMVKSTMVTHSVMGGFVAWLVWHFLGSDLTGVSHPVVDVTAGAAGVLAGAVAAARRRRRG
ncbi:MAG: hypothetical protein D6746_07520 [Bacteroidetes bacterium]|nr:MAG: hypothetical protein D6746_07520 [Bacteroidota bacterium]